MAENRPRGRERNVTGQGKDVKRRGSGLGTGPVGSSNRNSENEHKNITRSGGGGAKIIVLLLMLLLGGGGGIGSLLLGGDTQNPSSNAGNSQGMGNVLNDTISSLFVETEVLSVPVLLPLSQPVEMLPPPKFPNKELIVSFNTFPMP